MAPVHLERVEVVELHVGEDHHGEGLVYLPQVNLVRLNDITD